MYIHTAIPIRQIGRVVLSYMHLPVYQYRYNDRFDYAWWGDVKRLRKKVALPSFRQWATMYPPLRLSLPLLTYTVTWGTGLGSARDILVWKLFLYWLFSETSRYKPIVECHVPHVGLIESQVAVAFNGIVGFCPRLEGMRITLYKLCATLPSVGGFL